MKNKIFIFSEGLENFNEMFRKNVTYDDIKSCKKSSTSASLFKRYFWKNHRGEVNFHGNKQKTFLFK